MKRPAPATSADRAAAMLALHRSDLETLLALNAAVDVDSTTRLILDGLDDQARRYLARIATAERDLSHGCDHAAWLLGPNGHAPAIADICQSAEWHRSHGRRKTRRAA